MFASQQQKKKNCVFVSLEEVGKTHIKKVAIILFCFTAGTTVNVRRSDHNVLLAHLYMRAVQVGICATLASYLLSVVALDTILKKGRKNSGKKVL